MQNLLFLFLSEWDSLFCFSADFIQYLGFLVTDIIKSRNNLISFRAPQSTKVILLFWRWFESIFINVCKIISVPMDQEHPWNSLLCLVPEKKSIWSSFSSMEFLSGAADLRMASGPFIVLSFYIKPPGEGWTVCPREIIHCLRFIGILNALEKPKPGWIGAAFPKLGMRGINAIKAVEIRV